MKRKKFHMRERVLSRHFVIRHSKLEFIKYRDMKHEAHITLNIADYN